MGKALQKRYYDVTSALKSNKTWDINNMERLFKRFKQGVSIRERWDKLLWGGFSPEQIANCRELEKKYGGKCNLRFADTNPVKEDVEYIEAIEEDIK